MRLSFPISSELQSVGQYCISEPTPNLPFLQPNSSKISLNNNNIDSFSSRAKLSCDEEQLALSSLSTTSTSSFSSSSSFAFSSTKTTLCKKWMDIQGFKNWEGLLDPLDENLRGEIVRYGHFVDAAYKSCDFEPSSPSYAQCRYSKRKLLALSGLPETGYRVTKNLIATSGIQLPKWTERAPNGMAMRSSWIGYVAVCQDKRVISKLGRRDVVIALRGTATCLEWLENLRATLTPMLSGQNNNNDIHHDDDSSLPMVDNGFLSLYTSKIGGFQSLQDSLRQEIKRIMSIYVDEPLSFTVTGHSLGAALATLAAYDIKETFKCKHLVTVVSFGGPRVGNHSFRCRLEEQGTKVLRIVNSDDLITKVPGFVPDDEPPAAGEPSSSMGNNNNNNHLLTSWIEKVMEDNQWVYANVGRELRLSSRNSPELNGGDFATSHELKTYLHLVNGFVSSH
ncbi:OLC1v1038521C1 [Oldenlandia corymbosa var. corymbosa]|uniref:OLC1v1038521C1 n=1 Tax=Oldenlandia corymbosa var. corymbosa TaxID=529605 RepID=A0AAV1D2Q4_OLDCO|nr:OLC1v1038521C1 [Oldenlandia corymbosa var. corymbosa]